MGRYLVIASLFVLSLITYIDRAAISSSKGVMAADLSLSDQAMGAVFSAFALGYAIAQIPSGWFADRFGPRLALSAVVTVWSLFTALTGAVRSKDMRGRHTTSAATLYRLPAGGSLIDSPGVRSFRLGKLDYRELEFGFRELRPHIGHCRFADCRHRQEPGCAVREAQEQGEIDPRRLDNLLHMAKRMEGTE